LLNSGLSLIFRKKSHKQGHEPEIAQQGRLHVFDFNQN